MRAMQAFLGTATIALGLTAPPAQAQDDGNLRVGRRTDLQLSITTTRNGPVVSPDKFELITGKYYRLNITSDGDPDWRLELPDLLQNSHLRLVTINGIEIHLQGMVFRAIEFDQPGKASFTFTPMQPGTYKFTVGENPIALGLAAGQAGIQNPNRRAEGRFNVRNPSPPAPGPQ
jgi:hypothetical protein